MVLRQAIKDEGQVNSTSVVYNKKSLTFKGLTTVTMSVCFIHFAIGGHENQLRGQELGSHCGKLLILHQLYY